MIDPLLSLALSIQTNKGVYALLLGSGVSRSAQIPTGWEIVLDLIRRLAHLKDEDCEPDPLDWYKDSFGEYPDYSKLLDGVAKSPTERSSLLRAYFESTGDERAQGIKVPTAAHKAIAELMAGGYIRVIVTTNFDRLLEKALEEAGVTPTIISTPDSIEGAVPVTHAGCFVVKVNGDYLDTRIKNSPQELEKYDERVNQLLDRIFDEFGLVVCGWSGEWDTALRAAIERCKSHRFTTYWALQGEAREQARKLIHLRRATTIPIGDADTFFPLLAEKVESLEEFERPHPLSAKLAVVTAKRYLADQKNRIRLSDLVKSELEEVYARLSDANFPVQDIQVTGEEIARRLKRYESSTEILNALLITGCYWGDTGHHSLWAHCLERLANPSGEWNGLTAFLEMRRYPALLLLYSAGIASIAAQRYDTLKLVLTRPVVRTSRGEDKPIVLEVYTWRVIREALAKLLPGMARRHLKGGTAINLFIFDLPRLSVDID